MATAGNGRRMARGLATRALLAGRGAGTDGTLGAHGERPHAPPIHQSSNFVYPDTAAAEAAASGFAYLYGRDGNPTVSAFEDALAELEGADGAVACGSGMAALATAIMAVTPDPSGGEVLLSEGVYGATTQLMREVGARLGLRTRVVPAWDTDAVTAALSPETRAIVVETLTNPLLRVVDLPAVAARARERGVPLVVDATFTTPCLSQPLADGATLVVHSVSKYIAGHGDVIAGAVLGAGEPLARSRSLRRLLGGIVDPFAAWLALRGLRTLPLRMERQGTTAAFLAERLVGLPGVRAVHHPSLPSHPDHARARRLLRQGGAMVTFELADGTAARRFYDRVGVIVRAASLGEVSSLLTHPATFSHRALSPEERTRSGIVDGLLRLSVGLEDSADLLADIEQALAPS